MKFSQCATRLLYFIRFCCNCTRSILVLDHSVPFRMVELNGLDTCVMFVNGCRQ